MEMQACPAQQHRPPRRRIHNGELQQLVIVPITSAGYADGIDVAARRPRLRHPCSPRGTGLVLLDTHLVQASNGVPQQSGRTQWRASTGRYPRGGIRSVGVLLAMLIPIAGWCGTRVVDAATVKIGFLVDWGQRSPLYPAAAAAAARSSATGLAKSGIFPAGHKIEWVWHDTACDATKAYDAAEILLDEYGVDLLIGPACCAAAARASVLAEARGVPLVSWACSANYLSDKVLYPSFLRIVGPDADFAEAVGALFRKHHWRGASILFAGGVARGSIYASLAWQVRGLLERQGTQIGAWSEFSGKEACDTGAGDAPSARAAVNAAVQHGSDGSSGGKFVVLVFGECADYRQVMTYAASREPTGHRQWVLMSASRDPSCHVSARTCGRNDGRDAQALESMQGALSVDWASMPTSRGNAAAYAEAAAAHLREDFASEFTPPPKGNASPLSSACASSPKDAAASGRYLSGLAGKSGRHRRGGGNEQGSGSPAPTDEMGYSTANSLDIGFLEARTAPPPRVGDFQIEGSAYDDLDIEQGAGNEGTYRVRHDASAEVSLGSGISASIQNVQKPEAPSAVEHGGKVLTDSYHLTPFEGVREEYGAVHDSAPPGTLRSAALMFDATELGGRLLAAAAKAGLGPGRHGSGGAEGWIALGSKVSFEGLSGSIELDDKGNRKGMDISFWQLESLTLGDVSYLSGTEAARYRSATGDVQLLHEIQWFPGVPSEYADNKVRRDDLRAGNSKLSLEDLGHRPAPFMGLAITMVGISAVVSMLVIYRITRRRAKAVAGAENIAVQNVDHSSSAPSSPAAAAAAAAKVGIPGVLSCLATGDKGGQEVTEPKRTVSSERNHGCLADENAKEQLQEQQRLVVVDASGDDSHCESIVGSSDVGSGISSTNGSIGNDGGAGKSLAGNVQATGEARRVDEGLIRRPPVPRSSHVYGSSNHGRFERSESNTISENSDFSIATTTTTGAPRIASVADSAATEGRGETDSERGNLSPPRNHLGGGLNEAKAKGRAPNVAGIESDDLCGNASVTDACIESPDACIDGVGFGGSGESSPIGQCADRDSVPLAAAHVEVKVVPEVADVEVRSMGQGSLPESGGVEAGARDGDESADASGPNLPAGPDEEPGPPSADQAFADIERHGVELVIAQGSCEQATGSARHVFEARVPSPQAREQETGESEADLVSSSTPPPALDSSDPRIPQWLPGYTASGEDGVVTTAATGLSIHSKGSSLGGGGGGSDGIGESGYEFATFTPMSEERLRIVDHELQQIGVRATRALEQVEVDADDIAIGNIVGSGSFAEVRAGRVNMRRFGQGGGLGLGKSSDFPNSAMPPGVSKTDATMRKRAIPAVLTGDVPVAVKVIRDVSRQSLRRFWFEVLIMKDLHHPNIVRLLGATWRRRRLMMIVDYVERGNLATVLEEGPQLQWKDQKFDMCLDIAKGMAYLHRYQYFDELSNTMQNCVIHRDLKPQNLLVTHDFRVKITDFGEATGKGDEAARTQVGTLLYIAPEIVRGDRYDERCDVYSFAVVLLAMLELREDVIILFGEELLRRDKDKAARGSVFTHMAITNSIVNENLRPTLPSTVFGTLKILIEQCWDPAPALRPTFDEILEFLMTIARDEIMDGQMVPDDNDLEMSMDAEEMQKALAGTSLGSTAGASTAPLTMEEPGITIPSPAREVFEQDSLPKSQDAFVSGVKEAAPPCRGKKRGKNYRPLKGNTAMEFLEKHKELMQLRVDKPDTIIEEEWEGEDEAPIQPRSNTYPSQYQRGVFNEVDDGEEGRDLEGEGFQAGPGSGQDPGAEGSSASNDSVLARGLDVQGTESSPLFSGEQGAPSVRVRSDIGRDGGDPHRSAKHPVSWGGPAFQEEGNIAMGTRNRGIFNERWAGRKQSESWGHFQFTRWTNDDPGGGEDTDADSATSPIDITRSQDGRVEGRDLNSSLRNLSFRASSKSLEDSEPSLEARQPGRAASQASVTYVESGDRQGSEGGKEGDHQSSSSRSLAYNWPRVASLKQTSALGDQRADESALEGGLGHDEGEPATARDGSDRSGHETIVAQEGKSSPVSESKHSTFSEQEPEVAAEGHLETAEVASPATASVSPCPSDAGDDNRVRVSTSHSGYDAPP